MQFGRLINDGADATSNTATNVDNTPLFVAFKVCYNLFNFIFLSHLPVITVRFFTDILKIHL